MIYIDIYIVSLYVVLQIFLLNFLRIIIFVQHMLLNKLKYKTRVKLIPIFFFYKSFIFRLDFLCKLSRSSYSMNLQKLSRIEINFSQKSRKNRDRFEPKNDGYFFAMIETSLQIFTFLSKLSLKLTLIEFHGPSITIYARLPCKFG